MATPPWMPRSGEVRPDRFAKPVRSSGVRVSANQTCAARCGKRIAGLMRPCSSKDRLAQAVEAEAAAALPAHRSRDAALLPLDDLAQPRDAMGDRVLAQLDADVAPPHLVRHRRGRAGAEEGVEDQVAGVGGDLEDAFNQPLWLWLCQNCISAPKSAFTHFLILQYDLPRHAGHQVHGTSPSAYFTEMNPSSRHHFPSLFPKNTRLSLIQLSVFASMTSQQFPGGGK